MESVLDCASLHIHVIDTSQLKAISIRQKIVLDETDRQNSMELFVYKALS